MICTPKVRQTFGVHIIKAPRFFYDKSVFLLCCSGFQLLLSMQASMISTTESAAISSSPSASSIS